MQVSGETAIPHNTTLFQLASSHLYGIPANNLVLDYAAKYGHDSALCLCKVEAFNGCRCVAVDVPRSHHLQGRTINEGIRNVALAAWQVSTIYK